MTAEPERGGGIKDRCTTCFVVAVAGMAALAAGIAGWTARGIIDGQRTPPDPPAISDVCDCPGPDK